MLVAVTDKVRDGGTIMVDKDHVGEVLKRWFPNATEDLRDIMFDLQNLLDRDLPTTDHETCLGIVIEKI